MRLLTREFRVLARCMDAVRELTAIYHEQNGDFRRRPARDVSGLLP